MKKSVQGIVSVSMQRGHGWDPPPSLHQGFPNSHQRSPKDCTSDHFTQACQLSLHSCHIAKGDLRHIWNCPTLDQNLSIAGRCHTHSLKH